MDGWLDGWMQDPNSFRSSSTLQHWMNGSRWIDQFWLSDCLFLDLSGHVCAEDLCFVSYWGFTSLLLIIAWVAKHMRRTALELPVGGVNIYKSVYSPGYTGHFYLLLKTCNSFSLQVGFHGQLSNVGGVLIEGKNALIAIERKKRDRKRKSLEREGAIQYEAEGDKERMNGEEWRRQI